MRRSAFITPALALAVGLVAALAYAPTTEFPFVRYDDDIRLLTNEPVRAGISEEGLFWAFGAVWDASWSPLTWLSHMLDFSLFSADAGGHHATSVLLHALNTMLLFALLRSASGSAARAAWVALLFALHPIHVETVAWLSERKGLLAGTFGLASLWCYCIDLHRPQPRYRTLSLALFALGLMSKPVLVTLPFLLLLLERLPPDAPPPAPLRQRLLAIAPWLAMSALSVAITLFVGLQAGALHGTEELPLHQRVANALVTSVLYLWKLVWPASLAPFYPHPYLPGGQPWSALQVAGAAAFWAVVAVVVRWSGYRVLRIGALWYGITLLPVLGLVQTGSQAMADRYAYLPAVGVYLVAVWSVADALRGSGRAPHLVATALGAVVLGVLGWAGQQQIQAWRSSESLFRHAVTVTEDNFSMHYHLAGTLGERGRIEEAIRHYLLATQIHPGMAIAHYDLANTLSYEKHYRHALVHYQAAVAAAPDFQPARDSLGRLLIRQGDLDAAIEHYREEARRQPDSVPVRVTLAQLHRSRGDLRAAIEVYEEVARMTRGGERWQSEARALREELEQAPQP